MVACIFGTTRSAFSMRSKQVWLSPSCWAIAPTCSMDAWIAEAMSGPFRRTPLEIDKMVVMADATDTFGDVLALPSEALMLTAGRFQCLRGLLQAYGGFWGPARTAFFRLAPRALRVGLQPFELLSGLGDGLVCRLLFRGHGTGDRFDQLVLHMEQVR